MSEFLRRGKTLCYKDAIKSTPIFTNMLHNTFQSPRCEASKNIIYPYIITLGVDFTPAFI